jgi:RHS repeat-associated protein
MITARYTLKNCMTYPPKADKQIFFSSKTDHKKRVNRLKKRLNSYNYKFQGQERQDELGLNWDSFKWRNYDIAIGRFMSIDPLAEDYVYNSTYAFSENRVIDSRELEGLERSSVTKKEAEKVVGSFLRNSPVDWIAVGVTTITREYLNLYPELGTTAVHLDGSPVTESGIEMMNHPGVPSVPSQKSSTKSSEKTSESSAKSGETTNRGEAGKLEKSPTGKGSVPPSERAKERIPSAKEKTKEREANDNKCSNCGNQTKKEDTRSHHYPVRHADGGTATVPVCKDCHIYLHSKK